jgi:sporulation protein YlmC with PRC-barrel domain
VNLVHEVLDKQMLDSRLRRMGKVDGIVLELREGQQPRVICLEAGAPVLAHRVSRRLYRWVNALAHRLTPDRPGGFRIPWSRVREVGLDVHVDLDAEDSPVFALERWLRKHIVRRLPGGRRDPT